jgi:hypothetical protein
MLTVTALVTFDVAKKLIENAAKGNPHFKPHKGEHGGCSWFRVSGDAYSGIDLISKNVMVTATIDKRHVISDITLVKDKINEIDGKYRGLITSDGRKFDAEVWNAIGFACAARTMATELYVPHCKLSMKEGKFLVVPPLAAEHVKIDFQKLAEDNNISVFDAKAFSVEHYRRERDEHGRDKDFNLSKTITIWIGPFGVDTQEETYNEINKKISDRYMTVDVKTEFTVTQVKISSVGTWTPFKMVGGKIMVVSLQYFNYRDARNAYKRLLAASEDEEKIHCFQGENWGERKRTVFSEGKIRAGETKDKVLSERHTLN